MAQITKALANEWAGRGVNVNAIAPGYMRTENTRRCCRYESKPAGDPGTDSSGALGRAGGLCGAAVFLASAEADYVHGHVLVVDGGWMGR